VGDFVATWGGDGTCGRAGGALLLLMHGGLLILGPLLIAGCSGDEILQVAGSAHAALTVQAPYSSGPPQYDALARQSVYLTMRDGARLAADVWLPLRGNPGAPDLTESPFSELRKAA